MVQDDVTEFEAVKTGIVSIVGNGGSLKYAITRLVPVRRSYSIVFASHCFLFCFALF